MEFELEASQVTLIRALLKTHTYILCRHENLESKKKVCLGIQYPKGLPFSMAMWVVKFPREGYKARLIEIILRIPTS